MLLGKGSIYQHIYQIRVIFGRLFTAGLKVNAPKCSFGLNYIPYLGYIITRVGIKPYQKKTRGHRYWETYHNNWIMRYHQNVTVL